MDILVINVYCGVHSLSHDGIGIFFPVIALRTEAFRNDAVRIPDRAFRE
jgi:hypothetical protein